MNDAHTFACCAGLSCVGMCDALDVASKVGSYL